ncbi:MAG: 3-dehydroquinate synthase [Rickettsiaceae bacterium H1]|nr:3-dehydroquinate synthase [Rickettsiaceae bacterium H1]
MIELNCSVGGQIKIGNGLNLGEIISLSLNMEKIHIITDENVAKHHLKYLENSIYQANIPATIHVIEPGEKSKRFEVLEKLIEEILSFRPTYASTILAFGGGVVGDIAGVVATMVLRGINLVQIPTTLLAQVDSSVGGKCAINSAKGKNLIGGFCIPKLVLVDTFFLKTLQRKDFICGYAEVVKYAMLYDSRFFSWIQDNLDLILEKDWNALFYVIKRCCQMKLAVIEKDQLGIHGERNMLNFGHTVGHAIEAATGYDITHGNAVAVGMVIESKISNIDNTDLINNLRKAGLPTSLKSINKNWDIDLLHSYVLQDKKIGNNTLELTALETVGEAYSEYVSCDFIRNLLIDSLN